MISKIYLVKKLLFLIVTLMFVATMVFDRLISFIVCELSYLLGKDNKIISRCVATDFKLRIILRNW